MVGVAVGEGRGDGEIVAVEVALQVGVGVGGSGLGVDVWVGSDVAEGTVVGCGAIQAPNWMFATTPVQPPSNNPKNTDVKNRLIKAIRPQAGLLTIITHKSLKLSKNC